jgi:hypothetical protein
MPFVLGDVVLGPRICKALSGLLVLIPTLLKKDGFVILPFKDNCDDVVLLNALMVR